MYCTKCGKELKENEKFCSECGTPVKSNNAEQVTETLKGFSSKLHGFMNKVKDTYMEGYKSAMPKIPIFEIELNVKSEKLLQELGYKWFYSNKNGEKLRLYKYYTDGTSIAKVEIETFTDTLSDMYIKFNHDSIISLSQIIYDFIRLRNYIYVRYQGSSDKTKLVDVSALNDIVDNSETDKKNIEVSSFDISLSKKMYNSLKSNGFTENNTYGNDGFVKMKLKKNELVIVMTFNSKDDFDKSENLKGNIEINAIKNIMNANNNNAFETILKILELRKYITVTVSEYRRSGRVKESTTTFDDFINESNCSFEWVGDYEYESSKQLAEEMSLTTPKNYKKLINDDMKYNEELENNKKKKKLKRKDKL